VFFWEGQKADVAEYIKNCDSCQRVKAQRMKPQGELHPLSIPFRRWESISMDLITDLPETENGYTAIVVFVDRLSKMVHLAPCTKNVDAEGLGELMEQHVFRLHGVPQDIVSDRDIRFASQFWQQSCEHLKIRLSRSTAQHPQSDGQTERANGVLEDTLRHFVSPYQTDWDKLLSVAEFAMNNAYNESIRNTPFMLNYGQSPDTPVIAALRGKNPHVNKFVGRWQEQLKAARACLEAAQQRQKHFADKHRRPAAPLKVGDQVLISMKHFELVPGIKLKLAPRFIGPVPITEVIGPKGLAYRVELPPPLHRKHNVFHVSSLKKYYSKGAGSPLILPQVSDKETRWHVDCITDTSGSGKNRKYLVHWLGGGDSWEFAYRLVHAQKQIAAYWNAQGQTPPEDAYVSLEQLAQLLEGKQLSEGE
jgi:Integrase core domain/Integrase zinc binding domain